MDGRDIHHGLQPQKECKRELLYNSGGSIQKTLYSLSPEATEERMKFMIYCCKITQISKLYLSVYLHFNLSSKDLKSCYRHTIQDTSCSMSWHMKALPLKVMGPKLVASITPTLYMGNLVMRWKGGSTRGYPKTYRRHSRGPWTLNPGS